MKPDIISETNHWLVLNKPAGMVVEKNPWERAVEDLVLEYLSGKQKKPFVGIVHRLDRVTSGVLVVAKKKAALKNLNTQFQNRKVQKTYFALVEKAPPSPSGHLRHFLFKDLKNKKALLFETPKKSTSACALFYQIMDSKSDLFLLKIRPETGRFHQIRAQLAAIGCPILGDKKYGAQRDYFEQSVALHAGELIFSDPADNKRISAKAPFPTNKFWMPFLNTPNIP